MKIKKLSEISFVNPETIRLYRKKGMLVPKQNQKNGYYEYDMVDFLNLLYIRKLRGSNIPLQMISYTYTHPELTDIVGRFEEEMEVLNMQIAELEKQRNILQITLEHLIEHKESIAGAATIESHDDKCDCYFMENENHEAMTAWIKKIELFTQTIGISKELLCDEELPERVPIRIGIGGYRNILLQNNIPIPENAVICPKGTYVAANIELEHLDFIPRKQLLPMMDYIKAHHYKIDSDTTAFLFRIDRIGRKLKFIFRLRVKVV